MADGRMYMLQPSFAGGEISPEVAARVDLDKYQAALLQAKNCFIRPYGSVYRRPGLKYACETDTGYKRLQEFAVDADTSYLLEFRESYLRVYKDDGDGLVKKATVSTPFYGGELYQLRFAQSADVMFIASGHHPVQVLKRLGDTSWTIEDMALDASYYDVMTETEGVTVSASGTSGTVTLTASGSIFDKKQEGNWIRLEHDMPAETKSLTLTPSSGSAVAFDSDTFSAESITVAISGSWTGSCSLQINGVTTQTFTANTVYEQEFLDLNHDPVTNSVRVTGSVSSGTIHVDIVYRYHDEDNLPVTANKNVNQSAAPTASDSMMAGAKGWKVISHGTWAGSFSVQYSKDNVNWKALRTYTGNSDTNIQETGTFDEPTYIRVTGTITSGSVTIDLTRLPYKHKGTVKLTAYTSGTVMTGTVADKLASTGASDHYAFGPWSELYGYPSCVTFFQDRLCLAASAKYPYMVWMSRTGDYLNFGTEEVSGTLTDDSAIALSFISRNDYRILHLIATSDLIVMTEGNEWIISGSSTVTPTKVTPQLQTFRGCTDVDPVVIGSDIIYVQRRGKTVRDMQYNYASDSYDGADLTLLAKHITKNTTIVDATYKQEPDSMLFFVLWDGTCACLTYIKDQKVYAWSRIVTDGSIKAVCAIASVGGERVYFMVERASGMYIEELAEPEEYVLLDNSVLLEFNEPTNTVTVEHLAGKTVDVLGNGDHYAGLACDADGVITLPDETECEFFVVGLPYTSVIELPNIELQLRDGSMQGRKKKVSEVIMHLTDSLGGEIGVSEAQVDHINYEEFGDQMVKLYSGEKHVTVPNVPIGGFEDTGRVVITHSSPYPFNLSSIVRVVTLGG